ncbi:MAG: adenylate/guanylate cyclase domain-containing protein [Myxococcota bacterium]|nr:adenylate/guanylate cyclase domain-containing protein [Myxococcota bacterium]
MAVRPRSFRTRLSLVMLALLFVALGLVMGLVQDVTARRVESEFAARFDRAVAALRQVQALTGELVERELVSLCSGNPRFRTVLATASLPGTNHPEALEEANLWVRSLLPTLPLAAESDVFIVSDAAGELVFTKTDARRVGDDLTALPVLREAAERGRASGVWVAGTPLPAGLSSALFPDAVGVVQVWVEAVAYDGEIQGFVIAGERLDDALLGRLRELSGLDLALVGGGRLHASTLVVRVQDDLRARAAGTPAERGADRREWLGGQRFVVQSAEAVPGAGEEAVALLVLQNLDAELAFLGSLRRTALALGLGVGLVALLVALGVAGGVTRPVSELASAARRLGAGELSARVRVTTGDELEDLGDAFNEMAEGLEERERIRRTFERYVTPGVARQVLEREESGGPAADRRDITVVFFDLAGYTSMAERLEPEQTLDRLNQYFEIVHEAVAAEQGTVNQFFGDGVLAFWGAPEAMPDHALRACRAASSALESLAARSPEWERQGLPPIRCRIGIHTGECLVGELGAAERRAYGAVGDAMNLASRLEGANKIYGTCILASETTVQAAGPELFVRELDWLRVVGRRGRVTLYEVLPALDGASASRRKQVHILYERGLSAWRARDFATAREAFQQAVALDPEDGPSRTFLRRFDDLPENRLPEDWSPVHEAAEK